MARGSLQSIGGGAIPAASPAAERGIGWIRMLVGAVAVLTLPLLPDVPAGRRAVAVAVLGVAWAAAELLPRRARRHAALAFDLAAVLALHLTAPGLHVELLYVPLVVLHAHHGGPRHAAVASAAGVLLVVVGREVNPEAGPDTAGEVVALAAVLFALAALLDVLGRGQRAAVSQLAVLKTKAETVLDRSGDAIVVTDALGRVRQWNAAAERLTGLDAGAAVGRRCPVVLGLHSGERALDCSTGCALLGDADHVLDAEVWRPRPDGRRQPLLASVTAVGDGAERELIHSARDITKLKEADEAKSIFLATASHELKTPLTVIRGFANVLQESEGLADDKAREHIALIERRAVELGRVVERLLVSSRIEAGRSRVRCQPVDVAEVVAERVAAVRTATGRDVRLVAAAGLPPAMADGEALATVVDHLLENAVKYSPGGGLVSTVVHADDASILVSVADEGIGMDAEQRERCFERFWQAESGDVRRFGGTGIGLFIVKALVEAMGGEVGVTSEPGRGSTFEVSLPRADRSTAPERPEELPPGVGESTNIREFMRQIGVPTT